MIFLTANSLKPYAYESIQILGLPNGSIFRARFPLRWVEKGLLKDIKTLVGRRLLYSVRIWETDEVIPLRYGEITSAKHIGHILFFEYKLGPLISYCSEADALKSQMLAFTRRHNEWFVGIEGAERAPGEAMHPLIFAIDENTLLDDFTSANSSSLDSNTRWMNAVHLLGQYEMYDNLPFYKIEIIDKATGQEQNFEKGRAILNSRKSYLLSIVHVVAESYYERSTASRTPDSPYMELGPYEIEVTTDQGAIQISPRLQPLSGRYDRIDFEFSTSGTKRINDKLRAIFSIPKEVTKSYRPIFEIPVAFKPDWQGFIIRAAGLGALLICWALLNFEDDIRDLLTPQIADFAAQFNLVFFALTCVELVKYTSQLASSE